MAAPVPQSIAAPPAELVTSTRAFRPISETWPTANNAASLAARTRADQMTEPTLSAATGELPFQPESSMAAFKVVIRGAAAAISRGNVLTANLWEWSPLHSPVSSAKVGWTPTLIGRWTFTFNGTGSADNNTLGCAGGVVLATDLYCSLIEVVATYDRRGDMLTRWGVVQPAVEDGSPAVLVVDGLGSGLYTWEGRTTTNGDAFQFLARWFSTV